MCTGKRLLAIDEEFGWVAECGCGTVHLTVGMVSLALNRQSLRRLHDLIGSALEPEHPRSGEGTSPRALTGHAN